MSILLLVVGLSMVLFPGALAMIGRDLEPSEWGRISRASLWMGLRSLQLGLLLTAVPTVFRSMHIDSVADACYRVLGPVMPGGSITGWVSAAGFVALMVRCRSARADVQRLQREARIESWLGEHRELVGGTLVVLPTTEVIAYAAAGVPAQVVVSQGLVGALTPEELDAVVRHELAHLRHHHDRYVTLAAVVDGALGWVPGVRASIGAVRLGVERWADEEAATRPGARDVLRRALLKTTQTLLGPVPAFATSCTIVDRLTALDTPPSCPSLPRRAALIAPILLLTSALAACLVLWSIYTHHGLLGLVGFCSL